MNWLKSFFLGGMFKKNLKQPQAPIRKMFGRGTIMLSLLAGGAVAYGVARRNGSNGNLFQKIMKPFRLFR